MKTVCIYHRADFDGLFCREIARKFLPDAVLIGWDYGDPVDDITNGINAEDTVYMMDITIDELMGHPNLIWIDHHKSAMDKYNLDVNISDFEAGAITGPLAARAAVPPTNRQLAAGKLVLGYRIDGVAACRLAWQWFTMVDGNTKYGNVGNSIRAAGVLPMIQDFKNREVNEPLAVRLAGEYDIWDKRDPNAELFQHGLRSRELNPNIWTLLLVNEGAHADGVMDCGTITTRELLEAGRSIQYAKLRENESIIKAFGFTIQFEGFCLLACNAALYNSQLFAAGLKPEHDGCLGFNWDGQAKMWRVSLYTDKPGVDLSPVAVKYGGGGHRGACGFRAKQFPFEL